MGTNRICRLILNTELIINSTKKLVNPNYNQCRYFHKSVVQLRTADDRKAMLASMPKMDEGIAGAYVKDIDTVQFAKVKFPDENTPNMLIGNTRFADLPICNIKVTKNNTMLVVTSAQGKFMFSHSCGKEGFKNARKGSNVAAQAASISLGMQAKERGMKQFRVVIKGLGPGRMASIKGLQMSGLDIISITDDTPNPTPGTRPRKPKRL